MGAGKRVIKFTLVQVHSPLITQLQDRNHEYQSLTSDLINNINEKH